MLVACGSLTLCSLERLQCCFVTSKTHWLVGGLVSLAWTRRRPAGWPVYAYYCAFEKSGIEKNLMDWSTLGWLELLLKSLLLWLRGSQGTEKSAFVRVVVNFGTPCRIYECLACLLCTSCFCYIYIYIRGIIQAQWGWDGSWMVRTPYV